MIEKLSKDLPNIPLEVLCEWLEPFAKDIGWPPTNPRWGGILRNADVKFWKKTSWELKNIHARSLIKESPTNSAIVGMYEAFFERKNNIYMQHMGERSRQRCQVQLHQLINHGKYRNPLVLFDFGGGLEIVDGAHRLASLLGYQLCLGNAAFMNKLKTKPVQLYQFHKAWVGREIA